MVKVDDELLDEPLTPEQLAEIPQPLLALSGHCAIKGIQAGTRTAQHRTHLPLSICTHSTCSTPPHSPPPFPPLRCPPGALVGNVVGGVMLFVRRPLSYASALQSVGRYGWRFSAVGAVVSLGLMAAKLQQEHWNAYRIWDRAYRLQHSASQQRADQFSWVGGLLGALVMQHPALRLSATPVQAALAGASIGVSDGVLVHVISNPKEEVAVATKKGVKAVEDNVKEAAGVQPSPPPKAH